MKYVWIILELHLLSWVKESTNLSSYYSQVRERLKKEVEEMKVQDPNFKPGLVVLQVSENKLLRPKRLLVTKQRHAYMSHNHYWYCGWLS